MVELRAQQRTSVNYLALLHVHGVRGVHPCRVVNFHDHGATLTRRLQHYDNLAWQPWLMVAMVGTVVILGGIVCQVVQLVVSIRARDKLRVTDDPWNGRTLEWATASPPPAWNFAFAPNVTGRDAFWTSKRREL
jgi:heme/copper-type cytochrome/quinol oxidase subunit 1